ncbi:hypothetical protein GOP47_0017106 [Adiantum capillus-veneris]|uniref:DUF7780 domain-containing protein n=1 Tax=Adiantum capillus-veneris TaxID=13818 RepID=A0A9D4UJW4_ADICA|nr:hypothetical protein GOP47_0017106 [Adiantum capillus-veneris]
MRALVITEQLASASTLRSTAFPKILLIKSSSHNNKNNSVWGVSGCLLKHLRRCILLLFALFLCGSFAFALCTMEGKVKLAVKRSPQERRLLGYYHGDTPMPAQEPTESRSFTTSPSDDTHTKDMSANVASIHHEPALHGLGAVFMKGMKPMQNLIIANLEESCDMLDFRLFLRTLYRSRTMSRADLVLLFPWSSPPSAVLDVLKEEGDSFIKLHGMNFGRGDSLGDFDETQERKTSIDMNSDKRRGPVFWGANATLHGIREQTADLYDSHYGSVVGFDMSELDVTDAFSEFLTNPASQLRRWLCYQMLLGLLRFKFRLVMLVELGGVVIYGDAFANAKWKDFLHLTLEDSAWADAMAESNQIPLDESSSLVDLQGTVIKSVMGTRNMLDNINSKATTKRKRTQEHRRHSKDRERERNLLAGGHAHDDCHHLHDEGKDDSFGGKKEVARSELSSAKQGLMETVYGREVWNSLEQVDKQRSVISSRVILGSMRSAKGIASSMVVEIVRVALQRKNKLSFPDRALLSYLVQKSPHLLGRRVTENLQVMESRDSNICRVETVKLEDVLVGSHDERIYSVLHASTLNTMRTLGPIQNQHDITSQSNVTWSGLILANICSSTTNSWAFYGDCGRRGQAGI